MATEPIIIVHAVAAGYVLALGPVNLLRRRRDRAHRIIGVTFVGAMVLTCVSSFGIVEHGFTWLHGLAVFTLCSMTVGVLAITKGQRRIHRANMLGSYLGTCIAFVFAAVLPQRLLARMVVTDPFSLVAMAALIAATTATFCSLVVRSPRASRPRPRKPLRSPA